MSHHVPQPNDGVSADVEAASAVEIVVATLLLALLLQVFWRCFCSCYRNHVKKYLQFSSSSATNMEPSKIAAVEKILNYTFKNKTHLEEALTHSSCREKVSYERLEFLGDAALGLAVATHFFCLEKRKLNSGHLTNLRKASVNNETLARVAAKLGLYQFVRTTNTDHLDCYVKKYEEAVKQQEDDGSINISIRPPDILADIVESLAGAVYLDVNFDITKLWMIFKDILRVDEIELLMDKADGSSEISGAQDELYGLCGKRKWKEPEYSLVKDEGSQHKKKYVYIAETKIKANVLRVKGDEQPTKKEAKNSAAYRLICFLQQSGYM